MLKLIAAIIAVCTATSLIAEPTTKEMTRDDIRNIQIFLNSIARDFDRMGYQSGTPDGILSNKSRQAITEFLKNNNLLIEGDIDGPELQTMRDFSGFGNRPLGLLVSIVAGDRKFIDLDDDELCLFNKWLPTSQGYREHSRRGLQCDISEIGVSSLLNRIDTGIPDLLKYQHFHIAEFPEFDLLEYNNIFADTKFMIAAYTNEFTTGRSLQNKISFLPSNDVNFCKSWISNLHYIHSSTSKGLDGTGSWGEGSLRDAATLCQNSVLQIVLGDFLRSSIEASHTSTINVEWLENTVANFVKEDRPHSFGYEEGSFNLNFPYVFYMNLIFSAVEVAGNNFNWSNEDWSAYASWMKARVLEMLPIQYGRDYLVDGDFCFDQSTVNKEQMNNNCQNTGILVAQAFLRAAIVGKDLELAHLSYTLFHRYMSGIGEDGHPIFDGIRDCQAADYTMYAAAVLNDYLYLYSQVTDLDWEFSVNGGGTLKSVFEWAIGLTKDPNLANKYAQSFGWPDCIKNGERLQRTEKYSPLHFSVYLKDNDPDTLRQLMSPSASNIRPETYFLNGGPNYWITYHDN